MNVTIFYEFFESLIYNVRGLEGVEYYENSKDLHANNGLVSRTVKLVGHNNLQTLTIKVEHEHFTSSESRVDIVTNIIWNDMKRQISMRCEIHDIAFDYYQEVLTTITKIWEGMSK